MTLLRLANLTSYVDGPSESYTILAPLDDPTLASLSCLQSHTDCPPDQAHAQSLELREKMQLHLVPGALRLDSLRDGMLISTELRPHSLHRQPQVLKVGLRRSVEFPNVPGRWSTQSVYTPTTVQGAWSEITFGGHPVVSAPIEVDGSIIYLLSSFLSDPEDVVQTALTNLDLSTFIASLISTSISKELRAANGITLFAPTNAAFEQLGLVMKYLLLPDARAELRDVLRFHTLTEVVYLDELRAIGKEGRRARTIQGDHLVLSGSNGTVSVGVEVDRVGKVNGEGRDARVWMEESDLITSNGFVSPPLSRDNLDIEVPLLFLKE